MTSTFSVEVFLYIPIIISIFKYMKIIGITFTYNEELLVPFVLDYWKKISPDKLIVYDNGSTDNTVSLLQSCPFVEVRHYDTGGVFDEIALTSLRNACWKAEDADWIILTDFDEVPFYTPETGSLRDYLENQPGTIIKTMQYDTIRENLPIYENLKLENLLLHQYKGNLFRDPGDRYRKIHTFNKNKIIDMRYAVGCHSCSPIGTAIPVISPQELVFFHLRYLGPEYTLQLCKRRYDRLPERDKNHIGLNFHYRKTLEEYDEIISQFTREAKPYWRPEDAEKWTCKWGKWYRADDCTLETTGSQL